MTFWYLGTPYSKYPQGIEAAFWFAVRMRGRLVQAGVPVFSPIIHSHPVAVQCGLDPFDRAIWLPSEEPIMRAAGGLLVVRAEGWEQSKGLRYEQNYFITCKKPIVFMDLEEPLPDNLSL